MKKVCKPYKFPLMKDVREFQRQMHNDGLDFPVAEDVSVLNRPVRLKSGSIIPNALGIQPCEGFDGTPEGAPSDLIFGVIKDTQAVERAFYGMSRSQFQTMDVAIPCRW